MISIVDWGWEQIFSSAVFQEITAHQPTFLYIAEEYQEDGM